MTFKTFHKSPYYQIKGLIRDISDYLKQKPYPVNKTPKYRCATVNVFNFDCSVLQFRHTDTLAIPRH